MRPFSDKQLIVCKRAAVFDRTQNNDSLIAPKSMSHNGFLYFAQRASVIDFTRRAMLLFDVIALAAGSCAAETRMNT
jgi:hypothetical protein